MMAVAIGRMEEFRPQTDNIERMEVFFTANDIADAKQPAVLLNCIGRKTYGIVKNLLAPALPVPSHTLS